MGKLFERLKQSGLGLFFNKYTVDRADDGAVIIAWTALLSIFPLIIGLLGLLGLLMRDAGRAQALSSTIQTQFPSEVSELVGFLQETRELGGLLGVLSVLGLLWSGSSLFGSMAQVFNRFYGVPDRGFVWQKLMAFGMMGVYIVLILVTVLTAGVSTFLVSVSEQILPFHVPGFTFVVGWVVSIASAVAMFLALYRVVPNTSLQTRDVWRGAALGGVLFFLLNQTFPLYLQLFGGGFAAYKTLGLFLLFMTWFYILARIIVLGALLNAFLAGAGAADKVQALKQEAQAAGIAIAAPARRQSPSESSPGKVVLWAGLTAGVTGLTLVAAQRAARSVWYAVVGEEPPNAR